MTTTILSDQQLQDLLYENRANPGIQRGIIEEHERRGGRIPERHRLASIFDDLFNRTPSA